MLKGISKSTPKLPDRGALVPSQWCEMLLLKKSIPARLYHDVCILLM